VGTTILSQSLEMVQTTVSFDQAVHLYLLVGQSNVAGRGEVALVRRHLTFSWRTTRKDTLSIKLSGEYRSECSGRPASSRLG